MRNRYARGLYLLKLRYGFGLDFFSTEAMAKRLLRQLLDGAVKKSASGREQRGHLSWRQHRPAIGKHDVAADAESLGSETLSRGDGVLKFVAVRHQCRRGHNAALMTLQDGAIDAASEAEVVGVYNEPLHSPSLDRLQG
jgi:hypothetical protein